MRLLHGCWKHPLAVYTRISLEKLASRKLYYLGWNLLLQIFVKIQHAGSELTLLLISLFQVSSDSPPRPRSNIFRRFSISVSPLIFLYFRVECLIILDRIRNLLLTKLLYKNHVAWTIKESLILALVRTILTTLATNNWKFYFLTEKRRSVSYNRGKKYFIIRRVFRGISYTPYLS